MTRQCLLSIYTLVVLLTACTHHAEDYREQLAEADSLMQIRPDSALHLLESIPVKRLTTQADAARYALLMTQARDKNYIIQTDDSLIRVAVQYYDSIRDTKMQAQAYYNWGSVFRDKDCQAVAIEKYLMAVPLAQKSGDKKLLGRIYNNVGYIYFQQGLKEKADFIYRQAEQIGMQLKDTSLWAESIAMQGELQLFRLRYASAEEKLLQALNVLGDFNEKGIRADIAATLSSVYSRTGKIGESVRYAKQNIALQEDTLHCYRAFLLLGDAYFKMQRYDSAVTCFNKVLPSLSYGDKAGAYMRLAEIAKIQGDITRSLALERLYSTCRDSMSQSTQSNEVLEATQQVLIKQQQNRYEDFLTKYRYYVAALILVSILLIFALRKLYLQKIHRQNRERAEVERMLIQQHSELKHELKRREEQILCLQGELCPDVYHKVQRIIEDCKEEEFSKERLTEEEWLKLIADIDKDGIIFRFNAQYHLSEDEKHLCCLSLMGLSPTDKARVMHCTRQTVYRKERELLRKTGEIYEPGKLEIILKEA